jgi:hypothetical protein
MLAHMAAGCECYRSGATSRKIACFGAIYDELKAEGRPFAADTSDKYVPLSAAELRATLYEFKLKAKTSPMAQLADLYL